MNNLKKFIGVIFFALLAVSAFGYNYGEALQKSIYFYEAQQAGPLPEWNRVQWRGDATMSDGVLGGLYDAGDHVKFNLPMSYTASQLAWSLYEYKDAYIQSGQYDEISNNIKYILDYLLACWDGTNYVFQVGNGSDDHSWWGPVEVIEKEPTAGVRPVLSATEGISGVMAQSAAALALGYELWGNTEYLTAAESLFAAAAASESDDVYKDSDASKYYNSWSGPIDELQWAAIWLHVATEKASYLAQAESYVAKLNKQPNSAIDVIEYKWGHTWDDVHYGGMILLYRLTGKAEYKEFVEMHLDWWTSGYNGDSIAYTPGGLSWLMTWGSLRHSSTTAFLTFVYADILGSGALAEKYQTFGERQMNYILGDNPRNSSYIIGFGDNPPMRPHHRTAHGSWTDSREIPDYHLHTLYGALVGGPDATDAYTDDINDYIMNEVACDYNAGLVGALARMYQLYGGEPLANFPEPEIVDDEFFTEVGISSDGDSGVQMTVKALNRSAWPARFAENLKFRYFMDLSELIDAGYSAGDVTVQSHYFQHDITISDLILAGGTVYYVEVAFVDGTNVYPGGNSEHAAETQLQITAPAGFFDSANDHSMQGSGGNDLVKTQYIPLYDGDELIWGIEPDITFVTPGPGETPTPAPVGQLKVQYFCGEAAPDAAQLKPRVNIVNKTGEAVDLSKVTFRYYFTAEGSGQLQAQVDYAVIGSSNIVTNLVDGYLEIGFTAGAGMLDNNAETGDIQVRINKSDWSAFDQTNDDSFDGSITAYKDYANIPLYVDGVEVWPGSSEATPSPIPTPSPTPVPQWQPGTIEPDEVTLAVDTTEGTKVFISINYYGHDYDKMEWSEPFYDVDGFNVTVDSAFYDFTHYPMYGDQSLEKAYSLTTLPPGDYTFTFKCWGETVKEVSFTITEDTPGDLGDVNGDSSVNIVDALMIARHSAGIEVPGLLIEQADVNGDGSVNIVDALIIARYSAGLIPSL